MAVELGVRDLRLAESGHDEHPGPDHRPDTGWGEVGSLGEDSGLGALVQSGR